MDRVDKYKRIKDDQQQGKWKAKVVPQGRRDFRSDRYNNNRPRRDYSEQLGSNNNKVVGAVFQELVHQVLEKIKLEFQFYNMCPKLFILKEFYFLILESNVRLYHKYSSK